MNISYNSNIKINGFFLILLAAGSGKRLKSDIPKQYLKIHNKTILEHNISFFLKNFKNIYIQPIISDASIDLYRNNIEKQIKSNMLLSPIIGGKERKDSVFNGLKWINQYDPKFVIIHDAVRIINSSDLIRVIIRKLKNNNFDAIAPIVPIYDTIRYIDKNQFTTKSREKMFLSQTPQGFVFEKIFELYKNKIKSTNDITDEISLYENEDLRINFVQGNKLNIKITDAKDMEIARKILKIN